MWIQSEKDSIFQSGEPGSFSGETWSRSWGLTAGWTPGPGEVSGARVVLFFPFSFGRQAALYAVLVDDQ